MVNNLRYADDTVLIVIIKEELHLLLDMVEGESIKKGLELNSKKVEAIMDINRNKECPQINILINRNNSSKQFILKFYEE